MFAGRARIFGDARGRTLGVQLRGLRTRAGAARSAQISGLSDDRPDGAATRSGAACGNACIGGTLTASPSSQFLLIGLLVLINSEVRFRTRCEVWRTSDSGIPRGGSSRQGTSDCCGCCSNQQQPANYGHTYDEVVRHADLCRTRRVDGELRANQPAKRQRNRQVQPDRIATNVADVAKRAKPGCRCRTGSAWEHRRHNRAKQRHKCGFCCGRSGQRNGRLGWRCDKRIGRKCWRRRWGGRRIGWRGCRR
jgi:hypothetical protein